MNDFTGRNFWEQPNQGTGPVHLDNELLAKIKGLSNHQLVKISTDGTVEVHKNTAKLMKLYELLNCKLIELVTCMFHPLQGFEIIVDEEGFNEGKQINRKATALLHNQVCGGMLHGDVIVRVSNEY